jgi:hypothetical protein
MNHLCSEGLNRNDKQKRQTENDKQETVNGKHRIRNREWKNVHRATGSRKTHQPTPRAPVASVTDVTTPLCITKPKFATHANPWTARSFYTLGSL